MLFDPEDAVAAEVTAWGEGAVGNEELGPAPSPHVAFGDDCCCCDRVVGSPSTTSRGLLLLLLPTTPGVLDAGAALGLPPCSTARLVDGAAAAKEPLCGGGGCCGSSPGPSPFPCPCPWLLLPTILLVREGLKSAKEKLLRLSRREAHARPRGLRRIKSHVEVRVPMQEGEEHPEKTLERTCLSRQVLQHVVKLHAKFGHR